MLREFACVCALSAAVFAQGWVDRTTGTGPFARSNHGLCYDPVRGYTLMAGAYWPSGASTPQADTWSWDGTVWTPRGTAPLVTFQGQPSGYALVWHAAAAQMLMITFTVNWPDGHFDARVWDGTSWSTLASSANVVYAPQSFYPCAAYDPVRQETIAFHPDAPGKVGVWDGSSWTVRNVTSPAIFNQLAPVHMCLDPVANRLLLTGTQPTGGTGARFYEWNGFGWNQRLPAVYPARPGAIANDTFHNRVIMFDGEYASTTPNHTWTIANGTLTRLNTPIDPSLRERAAMAFDTARSVCVLFGGSVSGTSFGDTWEFDHGATASFTSYGGGCLGSRGVPNIAAQGTSTPRIGTTFSAHVSNLPWTGPAFMLVGVSNSQYAGTPLPIDLSVLGAPTCNLLTSIELVEVLTNVLGAATWSFAVPPVQGASFYTQVLPLDPGINPLGLTASNGGHGVIGL